MVYNLRRIEMTLAVQRDRSQGEGEPEVKGLGEAEELGEQVEEQMGLVKEMNILRIKGSSWFFKSDNKGLKRTKGLACLGL